MENLLNFNSPCYKILKNLSMMASITKNSKFANILKLTILGKDAKFNSVYIFTGSSNITADINTVGSTSTGSFGMFSYTYFGRRATFQCSDKFQKFCWSKNFGPTTDIKTLKEQKLLYNSNISHRHIRVFMWASASSQPQTHLNSHPLFLLSLWS